jgi:uncharacterized damage-inducible protein DinB
MNHQLLTAIKKHWQELRGRTYDLLDVLAPEDLSKRLPFAESQSLYYQFWCMLGAQESWLPLLAKGTFEAFACSLDNLVGEQPTLALIRQQMVAADHQLLALLESLDLLAPFENGTPPLSHYFRLVEHEAHHHGQLINLIYANGLPIPSSWALEWALTR